MDVTTIDVPTLQQFAKVAAAIAGVGIVYVAGASLRLSIAKSVKKESDRKEAEWRASLAARKNSCEASPSPRG